MVGLPSLDIKAFLIPALIALTIYLTAVYVLYPLYAHRQRYAQYVPMALDVENSSSILGRTRNGLGRALRPIRNTSLFGYMQYATGFRDGIISFLPGMRYRDRAPSFDSYFGDEELEDGVPGGTDTLDRRTDEDAELGSERRLSRELEAGFRDDSDSEEEGERRLGR